MREIPLTQGKVALVSEIDFSYLSKFHWYYSASKKKPKGYAARGSQKSENNGLKIILMHKVVAERMGLLGKIDHRNTNSLDNRRSNLRKCTTLQNSHNQGPYKNNKTGYKGVSKHGSNFKVKIVSLGKVITKSGFPTEREAALAYDSLARKHFGRFAWTNFDKKGERRSHG